MIPIGRSLEQLRAALARDRLDEVELYVKRGRSHRVELDPSRGAGNWIEVRSEEAGWAVRAGGRRGSFFACGTGLPDPAGPWPAACGEPLQLPAARAETRVAVRAAPPLMVESEAIDRLERFARSLRRELPEARIARAVLDDGESEATLLSSRGVDSSQSRRAAAIYLDVVAGETGRTTQIAAGAASELDVEALARQFATFLAIARDGAGVGSGRGDMVLAPAAAAGLLAGLLPLLVGGDGWRIARRLRDRKGRLAGERLTIVDDGALEGGLFAAAADGEGVPTREVVLIDKGEYRQPLLSWREVTPARGESSGCMLRPSWREPPQPGPTHLYIRPDRDVAPAALVNSVSRGYYWLDTLGSGRFDPAADRFELPVCGFRLRRGKATEPVAAARIRGSIGGLLRGITGVARDLSFRPLRALLGSPSLLVEGLELDSDVPATG